VRHALYVPPFGPDDVRALRAEIGRIRDGAAKGDDHTDGEPFDVCVAGPRHRASDYEDAGVTWLVEAFGPEEPLPDVRRLIADGPRSSAGR
jgi:hypothetical protein